MKVMNCRVHYGLLLILDHEPCNIFIYKNHLSHLNAIRPWQMKMSFLPMGSGYNSYVIRGCGGVGLG